MLPYRRAFLMLGCCAVMAGAQVPPDAHDHSHHGVPVEFKMPRSYAEAVREIENRMHIISELMSGGRLDQIHGHADVIRKAAKVAAVLAVNKDSGVAKASLEEVTRAARALVASFDEIDPPADAGDKEKTAVAFQGMSKHVAILAKFVPKLYACPMRCERDKTSTTIEKCSVCGMDYAELKAHADHSPRHGGTFFMAADNKHHLEGAMTSERQFRLYFYDEFTVALGAAGFSGEGTYWSAAESKKLERPIQLAAEPAGAFLAAQLDPAIQWPVRVKIFITMPGREQPDVFDFEFSGPSMDPSRLTTESAASVAPVQSPEHSKDAS